MSEVEEKKKEDFAKEFMIEEGLKGKANNLLLFPK